MNELFKFYYCNKIKNSLVQSNEFRDIKKNILLLVKRANWPKEIRCFSVFILSRFEEKK